MKDYGQFCGLSRVASFLGERWALMILRDLCVGTARFSELQRGLPSVPTNILTVRLRELEEAGVIERTLVPGDRGVHYQLSEWGAGICPIIDDLGAWGARRMLEPHDGEVITDRSLAAAINNAFVPGRLDTTITFSIEAAIAGSHGVLGPERIDVRPGVDPSADLQLTVSGGMRELMAGIASADDLLADGRVTTDADHALFREFTTAFFMPLDADVTA